MKKLKKVLSLVLVLAMALSVFGVCASATDINDYSDKSEITYTKAVGVLSGLKVLEGSTEDGVSVFKPTSTMNRAEAAAIATRLIGVQDTVVDATTFTDVEGWAKSYIAIAQSQGLINGRNATTYDPAGTLTGYEWEKIVLCALGYDAQIENLVGATWQASTAVLAGKVGLLKGMNDDYDATKAITREQAALIAYNALYAKTVLYPSTHDKIATFGDKTLGELVFGLNTATTEFDIYGAPVQDVVTSKKVAEVYTVAYDAVETYNNIAKGTKVVDIIDDLADAAGVKNSAVEAKLSIYVDGVAKTTTQLNTVLSDKKATLGGRGVDVAAYVLNDGTYRIVVKNTYVTKIATINEEKTNSNGTVISAANVAGLTNGAYLAADGYNKGDIIIYNVGDEANLPGKTTTKIVADNVTVQTGVKGYVTTLSFDGSLSAAQDGIDYIKIDKGDETYFDANTVYGEKLAGSKIVKGSSGNNGYYLFVYDFDGNIIYVEPATRDLISEVGHAYVITSVTYYTDNHGVDIDNLLVPATNPQGNAQALVVFYSDSATETETAVVDLAVSQTVDGKFSLLNKYGEASGSITSGMQSAGFQKEFVEYYKTSDDKYVLEACPDKDSSVTITAKDKKIDLTDSADVDATVDTKITVLTATKDPYTVKDINHNNIVEVAKSYTFTAATYTGYNAFATTTGTGYVEVAKNGKATVGAIMKNAAVVTEGKSVTAVFTGKITKDAEGGDIYTFITVDGDEVNLSTAAIETDDTNYSKATVKVTAGQEDVFKAADTNKVYTLYKNSAGKVVGYTELTATETVRADFVTWTGSYGYLEGTTTTGVQTSKQIDFASTFAGKVYDQATKAAKDVASIVSADGKDYVTLYEDGGKIVFMQTVGAKAETYTVNVKWRVGMNVDNFLADQTTVQNITSGTAVAAEFSAISAAFNAGGNTFMNATLSNEMIQGIAKDVDGNDVDDFTAGIDNPFVLTIVKTTYADGTASFALVSAQQAQ